jgi:spermidine synthase
LIRSALLLAFVSGACALVYESLWLRALALVFGNTVLAGATVMAAFMGGLALGGALLGRCIGRIRLPPVRVYALLELLIAGSALLLPAAFDALAPLLRPLYGATGGGSFLTLARLALSLLLLLVPTACMGGSFPALARVLASDASRAPRRLGQLYAVNTAGGIAGVLLVAFWLIPAFGVAGANALAVLLSAVTAAVAWRLGAREVPAPEAPAVGTPAGVPALLAAGIAGFAALAFEVLAFRVLLLVFGSTTYAFTIMLAVYLGGIALGSALVSPWLTKPRPAALAISLGLGGLALAAVAASVDRLPWLYLAALRFLGLSWRADVLARAVVACAFLLPPTLAFGAVFALALRERIAAAPAPVERAAGQLYAANCIGAILGSLAAGFLLLPRLGLQASLLVLAAALLGFAAWAVARRRALAAALLLSAFALAPFALRPWDRTLLAQGVYIDPRLFFDASGRIALGRIVAEQRLLYGREGVASTLAILEGEGLVTSLRLDGKVEMSDLPADRRLGRMMGQLPLLLHGGAHTAMNLGLGAGLTVAGLAAHPLARIDVVELEPALVEGARVLALLNRGVVDDPRVRVIVGDGRNHLRLSSERYDVITSDPFEPTVGGAASLFTREAFAEARARLAPGGLVCQWVPLYEMGPAELDSIFAAFASAFPHASVWFTGRDTLLIGAEHPSRIDLPRLLERMAAARSRADLEDAQLHTPERLLATYVNELGAARPFGEAPPNSDRFPIVEFAAPKRRWQPTLAANLRWLLSMRSREPPAVSGATQEQQQAIARAFLAQSAAMLALVERASGSLATARQYAQKALQLDPGQPLALSVFVAAEVQFALAGGDLERGLLALELDKSALAERIQLAQALLAGRRFVDARALAEQVLEARPRSLGARLVLLQVQRERGLTTDAERTLAGLRADFPDSPRVARAAASAGSRP